MSFVPKKSFLVPSSSSDFGSSSDRVNANSQGRAYEWLKKFDLVMGGLIVAALVALAATIVFIGLAQAQMITPLAALYAFCGCIACFFFLKAIHCCQGKLAKKYGIDLEEHDKLQRDIKDNFQSKKKKEKVES